MVRLKLASQVQDEIMELRCLVSDKLYLIGLSLAYDLSPKVNIDKHLRRDLMAQNAIIQSSDIY